MTGGKWYWETKQSASSTRIGVCTSAADNNKDTDGASFIWGDAGNGGVFIVNSTGSANWEATNNNTTVNISTYSTALASTADDIIMCALDVDSGKIFYGLNGTWFNSSDPAAGTGEVMTIDTSGIPDPLVSYWRIWNC